MSITDRVCLAGLDAMVLHLHDSAFKPPTRSLASSTQSGFTSSSFKHCSKPVIGMLCKPPRTLAVDVPSPDHEPRNNALAPSAPPSFVTKTSSSALHFVPHAGDGESRFQPLPAVKRTSVLEVHAQFLPNSHPPASLSTSERTGHAGTRANPVSSPNPGDYIIPSLQHPNSPYMPWASSIRSQIMRPPTPTSNHSRPSSNYSRPMSSAGSQGPLPRRSSDQSSIHPKRTPASKPGRLKSLRRSLKKRLGGLVRQLTTYTCRRPDIVIAADSVPMLSGRSFDTDESRSILTPLTQSVISISPSSDFVHLAEWLDERSRLASGDVAPDDGVLMSLDDYERRGSWLALVPDKDKCCGWACGRMGCDVHVPRARKPSMSLPALPAVQASAFLLSPSSIPARPPTPHISLVLPQS